jgi:hypothetical protein
MVSGASCGSSQAFSVDQRLGLSRRFAAALCGALLLAGCGGDDEGGDRTATAQTVTSPATATETETTETVSVPTEQTEARTGTSPEDQPGGAGDEEPARSQALFTGSGGKVRPTVVRVPAYIAIRIELRSGDGDTYALRFGNRTLRVDRSVGSFSASFSGLRPGKALTGEPVGRGNRVRVEATAEPGP